MTIPEVSVNESSPIFNISHDEGAFTNNTNGTLFPSAPVEAGGSFFDVYFSLPRFSIETTLALLTATLNGFILAAVRNAHSSQSRSVYNTLFVNLAVADILSCILSWLCNNIFFLFSKHLKYYRDTGDMCQLFVYLVAAAFVSNGFGIVSTLTMLGFTTVQYFAICRPLQHLSILRPKKVCIYIGVSWILSILAGFLPFFVLLGMSRGQPCNLHMLLTISSVVTVGSNTCMAILAVIYVAITVLCIRIYIEIRLVHKQMARLRYGQDFQGEKKAFITIIILLSTLTLFFIPYSILYVVNINSQNDMAGLQSQSFIYYMNLLPYLKFLSDPIIYGLRMREVRDGCILFALKCGFGKCKCMRSDMTLLQRNPRSSGMAMQTMTSFTRGTSETFYGKD